MAFGLSDTDLQRIRAACREFPQIREVLIFGSRAMGNYKRGSDVDLALKGRIDHATVTALSARLNEELPLPYLFDVVDYHAMTRPELQTHIDRYGKILYAADDLSTDSS
ncbi:MAG: nucleotidyltransferase domain-containing protein [Deltaproteobacteria bacterium]|nr:nucleotidyltransferase domain-containing protein [Deltaproteobacteria bacterium]